MIPLKAFILSLCAVIIVVITGFFYLEANRVLGRRFEEIDAIHSKSVVEYAARSLKGEGICSRHSAVKSIRTIILPNHSLLQAARKISPTSKRRLR